MSELAGIGMLNMLVVPEPTYKALSDAAKERNITVAVLLQRAVDLYLANNPPHKRQLLNEVK